MRIRTLLVLPLLAGAGALVASPSTARAQITISFGAKLGPEIRVFAYSQERLGEWRGNYRHWTPVTLYDVNGRYYRNNVRGARPIEVYMYNNQYFFPPQEQGWNGADRRYDYRRQPTQTDYGRGERYSNDGDAFSARLGTEVGVLAYSSDRAGDWRRNVRRWTPVTLYEVNGRYFPKNGPGGRQVTMYRYQNEYFLPPQDQDWVNSDRRFDYNHRPTQEDYRRARTRP
jgi:hypothetical protein